GERQGQGVLGSTRRSSGAEGGIETTDLHQRLSAESHIASGTERWPRVQRALRPMAREDGGLEAAALTVPAKLLEQDLRLSVQAGRQDQPCHAAHITAAREAARQGGQPEDVRLLVVIEECHDVTRGG